MSYAPAYYSGVQGATLEKQEEILQALTGQPYAIPAGVQMRTIVRGDSYDGTANAKLAWTTTKSYTTGWTGTFTVRHRITDAVLLTKEVEVTSSVLLNVTLTASDTAFALLVTNEEFGPHPYDIEMNDGTSQITEVSNGIAIVRKDRTTA